MLQTFERQDALASAVQDAPVSSASSCEGQRASEGADAAAVPASSVEGRPAGADRRVVAESDLSVEVQHALDVFHAGQSVPAEEFGAACQVLRAAWPGLSEQDWALAVAAARQGRMSWLHLSGNSVATRARAVEQQRTERARQREKARLTAAAEEAKLHYGEWADSSLLPYLPAWETKEAARLQREWRYTLSWPKARELARTVVRRALWVDQQVAVVFQRGEDFAKAEPDKARQHRYVAYLLTMQLEHERPVTWDMYCAGVMEWPVPVAPAVPAGAAGAEAATAAAVEAAELAAAELREAQVRAAYVPPSSAQPCAVLFAEAAVPVVPADVPQARVLAAVVSGESVVGVGDPEPEPNRRERAEDTVQQPQPAVDFMTAALNVPEDASPADVLRLRQLLQRYGHVFGPPAPNGVKYPPLRLPTKGEALPAYIGHPRRIARPETLRKLEAALDNMVALRVIKKVEGDEAVRGGHPIVIATKKNGDIRMCIDPSSLNAILLDEGYTLPTVTASLEGLAGCKVFGSLDLVMGFHQLVIAEEDRKKLRFVTPFGVFEFQRLPFGVKTAPSLFQKAMEAIFLQVIVKHGMPVYIDDCGLGAKDVDGFLEELEDVLQAADKADLRFSLAKSFFLQQEIEYLGQGVNKKGRFISGSKLQGLRDMGVPQSADQMRSSLMGLAYYRDYVNNFAELQAPFDKYLADAEKARGAGRPALRITTALEARWTALQAAVVAAMPLAHPNYQRELVLYTDASDIGIGAVLYTYCGVTGALVPVVHVSRKLKPPELKYPTGEKECLAVAWAFEKLRHYLMPARFLLRTDHANLVAGLKGNNNPRVLRQMRAMQEFSFDIEHVAGVVNVVADMLSRCNPPEERDVDPTQHFYLSDAATAARLALPAVPARGRGGGENSSTAPTRAAVMLVQAAEVLLQDASWSAEDAHAVLAATRSQRRRPAVPGRQQAVPDPLGTVAGPPVTAAEALPGTPARVLPVPGLSDHFIADVAEAQRQATPAEQRRWRTQALYQKVSIHGHSVWVGRDLTDGVVRLAIPRGAEQLHQVLLRAAHDSVTAGHGGVHRTFRRLQDSHVDWVGMRVAVEEHVGSCVPCQRYKAQRGAEAMGDAMGHVEATRPGERIVVDVIGPFSPSGPQGHTYALVMVDAFSHFALAVPMPDSLATTLSRALLQWVQIFGIPRAVQADNASNLKAAIAAMEHLAGWAIHHIAPYSPQSNGLVERTNRTLKEAVKALADERSALWADLMPLANLAYNTALHRTLGVAPAEVMLSFAPATSLGRLTEAVLEQAPDGYDSPQALVLKLRQEAPRTFELVRAMAEKATAEHAKYFAKGKVTVSYETGDLVFVEYPSGEGHTGMSSVWRGPMEVVRPDGKHCYIVRDEHAEQEHRVHVRRMRTVRTARLAEWTQFWAEKERNAGYQYGVKAVTGWNGVTRLRPEASPSGRSVALFRVKWEGYEDAAYDEWLPWKSFNSKELVTQYLSAQGQRVVGKAIVAA